MNQKVYKQFAFLGLPGALSWPVAVNRHKEKQVSQSLSHHHIYLCPEFATHSKEQRDVLESLGYLFPWSFLN